VHEHTDGPVWDRNGVTIRVAPTDHRPVAPTIGFRIESGSASVVLAGDTVPCATLDELAGGAEALVHTVIRKDIVGNIPQQRLKDICDYHSSVEQAAATAARAGVGTLVMTHYVPTLVPGQEERWRALAAAASSADGSSSATTCTASRSARETDRATRRRPATPAG
jgi:ribonuclease Z